MPTAVDMLETQCRWARLKEWQEILVIFSKVKENYQILASSDIWQDNRSSMQLEL